MNKMNYIGWIACGIFAIASGIFWMGCEETLSGTQVEIPYREEIVVQGYLTADGEADTLSIMRTLPPLEKWSSSAARITDASAVVISDGVEYPMKHIGSGKYVAEELRVAIGKSYQLRVDWKNLSVTATATIPREPEIIRVYIDTVKNGCDYYFDEDERQQTDALNFMVEYLPHGISLNNARFEMSYRFDTLQYRDGSYGYYFYDIDSSGTTNKAVLYNICLYEEDFRQKIDTLFVYMTEYEEAYTAYFNTRYSGDDDLFFGSPGQQPVWNVKGDGFGWFFGRSIGADTLVVE
ncbi:MAG: DUF4249 family protein [Ignavibacteriae bacterium]|nr:DUF4249 family protein [Ignavibacteriota bacterium]MCB9214583.1 DUF4249 family protein [Ignavibacteria bacterium]